MINPYTTLKQFLLHTDVGNHFWKHHHYSKVVTLKGILLLTTKAETCSLEL